jgi:chromosome segregation ATPase
MTPVGRVHGMTTTSRRSSVLLAGALVLITACGTNPDAPNAVSTWANSVCQETASLNRSVHDLRSDLTAGLTSAQTTLDPTLYPTLDQAKNQLRQRIDAVATQARALRNAIGAVPESASDAVRQEQQQLRTDETRADQAVKELQQAATDVAAADNTPELATQATIAAAALTAATQDVNQFLRSVEQLASSSTQEIRNAFSQAPGCEQLRTRPAPTG